MLFAAWVLGGFLALGFTLVIGELAFIALALAWLIVRRPFVVAAELAQKGIVPALRHGMAVAIVSTTSRR